jgi:hypothetical protein
MSFLFFLAPSTIYSIKIAKNEKFKCDIISPRKFIKDKLKDLAM